MSHHITTSPTHPHIQYPTSPLPPMNTSTLSLETLLRQKSFLQSRLKQLQLEIEQKQYYYQQIETKSQQNRQLYTVLVRQFNEFKHKCMKIMQQKDTLIQKLSQQLSTYKHSQSTITQQLTQHQSTILKLSQQNNRLKKEIIQKNIFIQCYLKRNKEYQHQQQSNKKEYSLHKRRIFGNDGNTLTTAVEGKGQNDVRLNEVKSQLFTNVN